jgi:exosome complex component RRP41
MAYTKRLDGRKSFEDFRSIEAEAGVLVNADGSARFKIGNTEAIAGVFGPKELHPRFLQDPEKGVLRCIYNLEAFAGMGDRVRPGPSRRSREISMVTEKALLPLVDLKDFPNAVVDVYIELTQTDAGSRCAGICAASMALAAAGIPMKGLVVSFAIGKNDNKMIVDPDYMEEHYPDYAKEKVDSDEVADIALAIIPGTNEFSLLQLDGEVTKKELMDGLRLAIKKSPEIYEIQKQALKNKYKTGVGSNE